MKNKCGIIRVKRPDNIIQLLVKTIAIIATLLLAVVLLVPCVVLAEDEFAGGDGSPEQPFEIATAEQLATVAESVYMLDKHFILVNDIDLDSDPFNEDAGWEPIGTEANPFTGSFDGGEEGYIITGLYINRPGTDCVGMFGYTGEDAEIRNLRLENVDVTGFRSVGSIAGLNRGTIENSGAAGDLDGIYEIGGLVGYNEITGSIGYSYTMADVTGSGDVGGLVGMNTAGTIKNSYATGNVTGNDDIGGLVGRNYVYGHVEDSITTITDSCAEGDVKGDDYVGGLVGSNDNKSIIENSYATGNVTGNDYVGGLAGSNNGTITDSHATGDVEEGDDYVGGLVGRNSNTITGSYATGNVNGNDHAGGLVGRNVGSSTVANSYAAGIVKGINWVGGLVGWIEDGSTVTDSYAAGDVEGIYSVGGLAAWIEDTGTIADSYAVGFVKGIQMVGGLVGCNLSIIVNSYYDYETTCRENGVGYGDGTGVTGLSTAEMKRKASFEGWDFSEPGIWRNIEDCTYPVFQWQSRTMEEINTMITMDKEALEIIFMPGDSAVSVTRSLTLPEEGANGTTISWSSDDTSIIANDGTVILPADENKTVILTATISKAGGTNQIKAFTLTVIKKTLESIAITTPAVKLTYMVGEALDISGLVITGAYDNGSTAVLSITTVNISGFDSSEVSASQTLTVTVEGKTASYDIAIVPAVTYNVTYDANGGTGAAPTESNKAAGAVFAAADNSFTAPIGKQFKEWNTAADGTGAGYGEGKAITMPANNLTLYAIWEDIPYVPSDNADLSGLVISVGTLSPAFEENITSYSVSVGSSVSSIEITPTLADCKAAVTVNGIEVADGSSGIVSLNRGANTIALVVTAENGTTSRTYTIIVNRESSGSDNSSRGGGGAKTPELTLTIDSKGNITALPELNKNTGVAEVIINNATLTTAFEKAPGSSDGKKTVEIEIHTVENASAYMLTLPASALSSSGTDKQLKIKSSIASVTLPGNMLSGIAGDNVKEAAITIGEGDKSLLPDDVKEALGDRPLVQLLLTLDGKQVEWNNPSAPVTVSIPYTPTAAELSDSEHIVVWYIDGSGNVVSVPNGRYDPATGSMIFTITHFSHYAVVYVTKSFNDLESVAWAKKPIEVLASKGILKGTSETEYAPQTNITRADFLYSLVRVLGVDAKVDGNFDDIGKEAYYYKEIAVARKLGITGGTGNNKFTPDASITRQDMMVLTERALRMLKRLEVQGSASELDEFSDKSLVADYAVDGMTSIIKEGLIVGSGGRINPLGSTTRAEAAVFLYRILQ